MWFINEYTTSIISCSFNPKKYVKNYIKDINELKKRSQNYLYITHMFI